MALLLGTPFPSHAQSSLAVPATGAYTGAYIDFGETEDKVTLAAIQAFEQMTGKHQAIVASSSYWGRGKFPTENVRLISDYGAVPLLYWSPWGPPYEQGKHVNPGPWKLKNIVAGDCDAYLDAWGAAARDFGRPVLVSFGCEPNSDWFPWAGSANGADAKNPGRQLRGSRPLQARLSPRRGPRACRRGAQRAVGFPRQRRFPARPSVERRGRVLSRW